MALCAASLWTDSEFPMVTAHLDILIILLGPLLLSVPMSLSERRKWA